MDEGPIFCRRCGLDLIENPGTVWYDTGLRLSLRPRVERALQVRVVCDCGQETLTTLSEAQVYRGTLAHGGPVFRGSFL